MIVLSFCILFFIYSAFGMDSFSEVTDSSDSAENIDLKKYTKPELVFDDSYINGTMIPYDQKKLFTHSNETEEKFGVKNLSQNFEGNFDEINKLKRKHKSNKTISCEFCQEESHRYKKGPISGKSLCTTCYAYEQLHGQLIPRDERKKHYIHKNILVCEFCQKESKQYIKGKVSGKSLCIACYTYEYRNGNLIPRDERKKHEIHENIIACEFCQKESKKYKKGPISGKSLCITCYAYEHIHGQLIPRDERKKHYIHKNILACEFCQEESKQYIKGKLSGKSLCGACYQYEKKNGNLGTLEERKKLNYRTRNHKKSILVCEFCQKESTRYKTGKFSGKSLCDTCYVYESRNGKLVPPEERNKAKDRPRKHKHSVLVCECCEKESTLYKTGKVSGKSLCDQCYKYERRNGHLLPPNDRNKRKHCVLECEFCQKESIKYTKSQISDKSLCDACYKYECRHGHLIPLDKRNKPKHCGVLECEFCQKESTTYRKSQVSDKSLCATCYQYEYRHGNLIPSNERRKNINYGKQNKNKMNQLNNLIDAKTFPNENEFKPETETVITENENYTNKI